MTNVDRAIGAALEAANEVNRLIGSMPPGIEKDKMRKLYLALVNAPVVVGLATIEENEEGTHDFVPV